MRDGKGGPTIVANGTAAGAALGADCRIVGKGRIVDGEGARIIEAAAVGCGIAREGGIVDGGCAMIDDATAAPKYGIVGKG